jgi:hypothetical protein
VKGKLGKIGRDAIKFGAAAAARSASSPSNGRGVEIGENGSIRIGTPESINDLGTKNGWGMTGNKPVHPAEIGARGFNPFNIPPGVSISGAETGKCGSIITFETRAFGFTIGNWSVGYREDKCDPFRPSEEEEKPWQPTEGAPDYGPPGNAEGWKSRCPVVTAFFWDTPYPFYDWPHVRDQLFKLNNPWGFDLRISFNPPVTSTDLFAFVRLDTVGDLKEKCAPAITDIQVGHWVRAFEFDHGSIFGVRLTIDEKYLFRGIDSSMVGNWLLGIEPIKVLIPGVGARDRWLLTPYSPGSLIWGAEQRRQRWMLFPRIPNCPPPGKVGGGGGGIHPKRGKSKMDDCCKEILENLDAQDEKISRLLDLLDPEGAWPITVPGQMIQLDDEKAQPLQLKSYPDLWVAQLATQNRLREVAAPPGAWPLKFPKGIIEPMGKGNLEIQSIGAMLMAILRGIDAKLGPIVNEVEIADGSPLEPGNQKVSLRFFGLSSLACQILQIAIDNEGDIDLSNNMLLRLAMTSAATQKAATQSALQTSEILDALGAKYQEKVEKVPFFFDPQAAAKVAENLENTEESTEALVAAILDTSTQKIKYLSVDEKRNIVMRLTQMEQAINTIQAGQAVEWDGSKKALTALMGSYMLIDQIQDYKLRKELRNLDNQGDFGEWSKQHEEGYPEANATDEYSDTGKPWGRDRQNQPKIRKVDTNPDRED